MYAAISAHDVFDVLVVVHVACAIVGFGSLMVSGVYGFSNRNPDGPGALEEARRYFKTPGRLQLLVVLVPFLGVAALLVQPHGRGAGQLWAILAAVIWLVAVGVLFGVARPAEVRVRAALFAPDVDTASIGAAAARLGWAGLITDIAFFVALILMIFQPH